MTQTPMMTKATATSRFTLLVCSVRPATVTLMGFARPQRRSLRRAASHTSAMTSSGMTMPNTNASPRTRPPSGLPERADRVITPARTGAQQLDAIPENTPRLKKVAVSPRVVSGARSIDGIDHIRPLRASRPRPIMSRPPAQYRITWYLAIAPASRLTPSVIGTRTSARPAAKTKVSGRRRHRLFLTAAARYDGARKTMQQGANSATVPAKKAARMLPVARSSEPITRPSVPRGRGRACGAGGVRR